MTRDASVTLGDASKTQKLNKNGGVTLVTLEVPLPRAGARARARSYYMNAYTCARALMNVNLASQASQRHTLPESNSNSRDGDNFKRHACVTGYIYEVGP